MAKPQIHYYKLDASKLFSKVRGMPDPECGAWIKRIAADLVAASSDDEFAAELIAAAVACKDKKVAAGIKGMASRYRKDNTAITQLDHSNSTATPYIYNNTIIPPTGDYSNYIESRKDLSLAWSDFVKHRAAIKKPMSDLAKKRMMKKLQELEERGYDPCVLMDESIRNGWQDVFISNHTPRAQAKKYSSSLEAPKMNNGLPEGMVW